MCSRENSSARAELISMQGHTRWNINPTRQKKAYATTRSQWLPELCSPQDRQLGSLRLNQQEGFRVMEKQTVFETELEARALIRQAGLDKAAMEFPEDVAVAIKTAAQARSGLVALAPDNVAAEPWPPMRMRSAT
jgi:hypothetical protein